MDYALALALVSAAGAAWTLGSTLVSLAIGTAVQYRNDRVRSRAFREVMQERAALAASEATEREAQASAKEAASSAYL